MVLTRVELLDINKSIEVLTEVIIRAYCPLDSVIGKSNINSVGLDELEEVVMFMFSITVWFITSWGWLLDHLTSNIFISGVAEVTLLIYICPPVIVVLSCSIFIVCPT